MLDKIAHLLYTIGVMRKDIPSSKMLGDTKMEKQVKDYPEWDLLRFEELTLTKDTFLAMSKEQKATVNDLHVLSVEDDGRILVV